MPTSKLHQVPLRSVLKIIFGILHFCLLNLQQFHEHFLLESDVSCEFLMVRLQVSNKLLFFLQVERIQSQIISLENLFQLSDHGFSVGLGAPQIELVIVDIVQVS